MESLPKTTNTSIASNHRRREHEFPLQPNQSARNPFGFPLSIRLTKQRTTHSTLTEKGKQSNESTVQARSEKNRIEKELPTQSKHFFSIQFQIMWKIFPFNRNKMESVSKSAQKNITTAKERSENYWVY